MAQQLWHDGKLYEAASFGPMLTWLPCEVQPIVNKPASALAEDAKMPVTLWWQVLAFMQWGFDTHKAEVQVMFFHNLVTKEWAAWGFPQLLKGMSVDPIEDDTFRAQRKEWGKGWVQLGTCHHHCEIGAFASGVDKADERNRDGIHITVGFMQKARNERDWDVRATVKGQQTVSALEYFVRIPTEMLANVPGHLRTTVRDALLRCEPEGTTFPEQWKENCKEMKKSVGQSLSEPLQRQLPGTEAGESPKCRSAFFNGHTVQGIRIQHPVTTVTTVVSGERIEALFDYWKMMNRREHATDTGMRSSLVWRILKDHWNKRGKSDRKKMLGAHLYALLNLVPVNLTEEDKDLRDLWDDALEDYIATRLADEVDDDTESLLVGMTEVPIFDGFRDHLEQEVLRTDMREAVMQEVFNLLEDPGHE